MRYTKYLSNIHQTTGNQELKSETLSDLLNIVHLEGAISSLEKVKLKNKNTSAKYKYEVWIKKYEDKLDGLTGDLPPKDLFKILMGR